MPPGAPGMGNVFVNTVKPDGTREMKRVCIRENFNPACCVDALSCDQRNEACCNRAPSKCNWSGGQCIVFVPSNCSARTENHCELPAANHNPSHVVPGDCEDGWTGGCSYKCDNDTWKKQTNTCKADCSAETIDHCSLSSESHNSSRDVIGSCTGGYIGNCSYKCNNGVWGNKKGGCTAPRACNRSFQSIPGGVFTCWRFPRSQSGSTVSTRCWTRHGATGQCTFSCYNGIWSYVSHNCIRGCPSRNFGLCYVGINRGGGNHGDISGICGAYSSGTCSYRCNRGSWDTSTATDNCKAACRWDENNNGRQSEAVSNLFVNNHCQMQKSPLFIFHGDIRNGACNLGYKGTCSFKCNNGRLNQVTYCQKK